MLSSPDMDRKGLLWLQEMDKGVPSSSARTKRNLGPDREWASMQSGMLPSVGLKHFHTVLS